MWNLNSNALRPDAWTSGDAAGLPILPGLVRYDEVASGLIDHAIRVTVPHNDRSYLWPARHDAGSATRSLPPMGSAAAPEGRMSTSRGTSATTR